MSKKWIIASIAVIVAIAAVWGGSVLYARGQNDKAPEALALSTADGATPAASAAPSADGGADGLSGDWTVAAGSQAGYRVAEVLNGQDVTVVGRTEDVTGTVTVAGSSLSAAEVTVAMDRVTTDDSSRDSRFLDILKTAEHPTASFSLTEAVDIAAIAGGVASVEAAGELTVAGVSAPVTVSLQAQQTASGVEVSGTIPISFADYGVTAPNLGFVKVEDSGSIEMLLTLSR